MSRLSFPRIAKISAKLAQPLLSGRRTAHSFYHHWKLKQETGIWLYVSLGNREEPLGSHLNATHIWASYKLKAAKDLKIFVLKLCWWDLGICCLSEQSATCGAPTCQPH